MNRYIVVFRSHHEGPADITSVEAWGASGLAAVLSAKREVQIFHPWVVARAYAWPKGCADIEAAAKKIAGSKR